MVLSLPTRKISILIVCSNRHSGQVLGASLSDAMAPCLGSLEIVDDVKSGMLFYQRHHPDVVLISELPSSYSEAFTIRVRKVDGRRHTGILVMAPMLDNFDQLAEDNYAAGADDVVSSRISAAILRSKIISVFNLKLTTDDLRTAIHKLQQITLLDELTGLANMRGFLKGLSNSMEHNKRTGIAVAMMDLDRFKRINDTTNHMVGSHIIKSVGRILYGNSCFGPLDFAARYGGDEFIIILHGDTMLEQKMKMESLRKIIEKTMFQFQDFNLRVTASIGLSWASRNFNGKPEDLVKLADAMLYRSKDLGRNRVSAATFDEGYKNQSLKVTQLQPADDKCLVKTVNKKAG